MWDLIVSVPDHCLYFYFTSAASSPRLLEIGIHLQILSSVLLKEQKTLLLSSLLL